MDYGLTCDVLTGKHFLSLTEEEFEAARKARRHLFEVLDIEEKLNIVLEDYIEYELELLQITLEDGFCRNFSLDGDSAMLLASS